MYNEIDGNFEDVAISTFKSGLPTEHGLRKSLMGKPVTNLRQLMDRIEEHKRVEDYQSFVRSKNKVSTSDWRDNSEGRFSSSQPRREYYNQVSLLKW